jgi:hypothetical protein
MATQTTAATDGAIAPPRRKDLWWITPLLTVLVFGGFVVYGVWRLIEGFGGEQALWHVQPYLSPFFAYDLPALLGFDWSVSPALFVLPIPLAFRLTCYYFRKAGYRSFLGDPHGCAVPERRTKYEGETKFPFVWVNIHRITFFFAALLVFLTYKELVRSFIFDGKFGVGVGTLLYLLEAVMVSLYTFSCHYLRHLVGGKLRCFSRPTIVARYGLWRGVSALNVMHMQWFWLSLFSIVLIDLYVRLLGAGLMGDWRWVAGEGLHLYMP